MKGYAERGVTLIEVLIAVIVVAILVAAALPSFSGHGDRKRLIAAAEAVRSELEYARSLALKKNQNITVQIANDASSWCLGLDQGDPATTDCDCDTTPGNCAIDATVRVLNNGKPAGTQRAFGSTNLTNNLGATTMGFESVRGASSRAGSVVLTSAATETIQITLNLSGLISVCSNSLTPYARCNP